MLCMWQLDNTRLQQILHACAYIFRMCTIHSLCPSMRALTALQLLSLVLHPVPPPNSIMNLRSKAFDTAADMSTRQCITQALILALITLTSLMSVSSRYLVPVYVNAGSALPAIPLASTTASAGMLRDSRPSTQESTQDAGRLLSC